MLRKLVLRKETLTELSHRELEGVAGAAYISLLQCVPSRVSCVTCVDTLTIATCQCPQVTGGTCFCPTGDGCA